jgi:hypothetical protein
LTVRGATPAAEISRSSVLISRVEISAHGRARAISERLHDAASGHAVAALVGDPRLRQARPNRAQRRGLGAPHVAEPIAVVERDLAEGHAAATALELVGLEQLLVAVVLAHQDEHALMSLRLGQAVIVRAPPPPPPSSAAVGLGPRLTERADHGSALRDHFAYQNTPLERWRRWGREVGFGGATDNLETAPHRGPQIAGNGRATVFWATVAGNLLNEKRRQIGHLRLSTLARSAERRLDFNSQAEGRGFDPRRSLQEEPQIRPFERFARRGGTGACPQCVPDGS